MEKNNNKSNVTMVNLDKALRSAYSVFSHFDKDNSGTLEKEELLGLMEACNISVDSTECQQCLEQMDRNGDGVWDFTEFMSFIGMIYNFKLSNQQRNKQKQPKVKPKVPARKDSLQTPSMEKNKHCICETN